MPLILILDHDDSFTYNISQSFQSLGFDVEVCNHRRISRRDIDLLDPAALVLGPGPGHPRDSLLALHLCNTLPPTFPILGICLGHQILGLHLGASVEKASRPLHGIPVELLHEGTHLFEGISQRCWMVRYNSLEVILPPEDLPSLEVSARSLDGAVMALQYCGRPWYGVQFHPESIGSTEGLRILSNFGGRAGTQGTLREHYLKIDTDSRQLLEV